MDEKIITDLAEQTLEVANETRSLRDEFDRLAEHNTELRLMLRDKGAQPAGDRELGAKALGHHVRQVFDLRVHHKAAADMTISTDERGGHLVPVEHHHSIDALVRPEGSLLARCQFHEMDPLQTYRVPSFSAAPNASWQLTEGGDLTEGDMQITATDCKASFVGAYFDASYQLLQNQDAQFVERTATEVLNAVREKVETSMISGDSGVDAPFDGALELSGTNDQTDLATPTQALLSTFVQESLVDCDALWERGVIVVSPAVCETLLQNGSTSAYTSRFRFGERDGQLKFDRWDVVVTPAVTDDYVIMLDPSYWHVARFGYSVLIDEHYDLSKLMTRVAIGGWFGVGCSLPSSVSKADVTALA